MSDKLDQHADRPVIDVEEFAKKGQQPPRDARYRIRVDKSHYVVDVSELTGRQILELAGKVPVEHFRLDMKMKGGETHKVELDQVVDLTTPGLERFLTLPLDQTEGEAAPSVDNLAREFDLPEEDVEHLTARALPWETVVEGGQQWLLLHHFPIPHGYNSNSVTAAILIPPNYGTVQLDMIYFHPPLQRVDHVAIPNVQCTATIRGRFYQGWSRHRTAQNPWRQGTDNVATHLALVEEWLLREFRLRPLGGSHGQP